MISSKYIRVFPAFVLTALFAAVPALAQQSDGLSITVTPTLFQLSIAPGETWSSSVKVVNNNSFDATYNVQALDFEAGGEDGTAKYIPLLDEVASSPQSYSLASWLQIPKVPIFIKAGRSQEVPFTLRIPNNAEPGGHYAALLVGTKPQGSLSGSGARISSFVSSLMFVRIKGETIESGRIREFSTKQDLYQEPKADFVLRFENTGNTHVRPSGDIEIYNMWGKERGKIKINEDGNFGNVLPKSIRKFQFTWEGQASAFDIGPYSAVVTLAYGEDGRKNISAKTYFWVIPTGPVVTTLGSIAVIILLFAWFIRRYIRRALELEKKRFSMSGEVPQRENAIKTLLEPLKEGVVDMRNMSRAPVPVTSVPEIEPVSTRVPILPQGRITLKQFAGKYSLFFVFVGVVVISTLLAGWYFERALEQHRAYRIQAITSEVEEVSQ